MSVCITGPSLGMYTHIDYRTLTYATVAKEKNITIIFKKKIWGISRARLLPRTSRTLTHPASFVEARVTTRSSGRACELTGRETSGSEPHPQFNY